jgi:hypothetical protein
MVYLVIEEPNFYSEADESYFFSWLNSIPGVNCVVGESHGVVVSFLSCRLSRAALQDLIALHARYGLTMEGLARFETPKNTGWFRAPEMYWHEQVFGKSTDPSSRFVRSPFVRWLNDGVRRGQSVKAGRADI